MSNYSGNPTLTGLVTGTEIPDDGKKLMASDVNVAIEAAFDNFAYLQGRGLVGVYSYVYDVDPFAGPTEVFSSAAYTVGAKTRLDVPSTKIGDIVNVDFYAFLDYFNGVPPGYASLRVSATQGFGASGAVTAPIPGARAFLPAVAGAHTFHTGALAGTLIIAVAGTLRVFIEGKVPVNGQNLYVSAVVVIRATVLRKG